jgi:hypothetical protein
MFFKRYLHQVILKFFVLVTLELAKIKLGIARTGPSTQSESGAGECSPNLVTIAGPKTATTNMEPAGTAY